MNETDELDDRHKFFNELGASLNKYHFMISEFVLGVAIDDRMRVISFNSDGKRVLPVYNVPDDLIKSNECFQNENDNEKT